MLVLQKENWGTIRFHPKNISHKNRTLLLLKCILAQCWQLKVWARFQFAFRAHFILFWQHKVAIWGFFLYVSHQDNCLKAWWGVAAKKSPAGWWIWHVVCFSPLTGTEFLQTDLAKLYSCLNPSVSCGGLYGARMVCMCHCLPCCKLVPLLHFKGNLNI